MRFRYGALGVALLIASSALAQEQTASIQGTLRDPHGGLVPGVFVAVTNARGLALEVASSVAGVYRFAALPPGDYTLDASLTGFVPARVERISLRLGQIMTIDLTLDVAAVAEAVTVLSETPLIAITQSVQATSLRDEEIQMMPRGRDYTTLIVQVPGVNAEPRLGGYSIDGASAAENRFIIDGAEHTSTRWGRPAYKIVTDFIDEVQVKSSGYSAEFGGATGGVVNAVTRTGANTWHGDALLYWSSDVLDAGPRPSLRLNPDDDSVAEYVRYSEDEYSRFEPGFTVGGPIVRDAVWFFAGYIPSIESLDRTVTFLDNGKEGRFQRRHHVDNVAASVNAQLGPRWRLRTSFTLARHAEYGSLPQADGADDPEGNYDIDTLYPLYTVSGSVDYTASTTALLSLRAGYYGGDSWTEGVYQGDLIEYWNSSLGRAGVPLEYQHAGGYSNEPTNQVIDRHRDKRLHLQLDGTLDVSWAGQHQLKTGVQLDRVGLDVLHGHSGNTFMVFWGLPFNDARGTHRGPFGVYRVLSNRIYPNRGSLTEGNAVVNNLGLFVQDSWTINRRLTLNLGLRTENERVPSYSENPEFSSDPIQFGFGDKLAPRLGFAWDVRGDGRTKLFGSWGLFYDIMKLQLPLRFFGGKKELAYFYTLEDADLSGIENNPACPPDCPGTFIAEFDNGVPANDTVATDLEPMRLQEAAVGLEHQLHPEVSLGLRYLHKQLDRAVETVGSRDGNRILYSIANPGFGDAASFVPDGGTESVSLPPARRDYDAVEVALWKRMSAGWSARLSYTWSRLWGNYSGLTQSDEGRTVPNSGGSFDHPLMSFDETGQVTDGVLATDRTHQIKAHFIGDFRFGTTLGLSWYGASGLPRSRTAYLVPPWGFQVLYRGRNSDGRTPFLSRLDLYLQHQFRLSDKIGLTLSVNVFNLLNQATAMNYFQREVRGGVFVDEADYLQGVDVQQLIEEQGTLRDPRFLMPKDYQPPRSIRLGTRISF